MPVIRRTISAKPGTVGPNNMPPLPLRPSDNASQEELLASMGDLLVWALNQRLGQMMAAGFSGHELIRLRTMAVRCQRGHPHIRDLNELRRMLPKFEKVHITKRSSTDSS